MKLISKQNLKDHSVPLLLIVSIQIVALLLINPLSFDSHEYLSISKNLFEQDEYSIANPNPDHFPEFKGEYPTRMRQPLYPLFLTFTYWLPGESINFVLILQILLNISSYFIIYKIAILIFSDKFFKKTKYILALYFPLWILSTMILSETLFIFLLTLYLYLFIEAAKRNKKYFVYAGFVLGLVFLTRPIALFVLIISILYLIFEHHGSEFFKKSFLILLPFLIAISPWFIRNGISLGDYTPLSSDGNYNFWSSTLGVDNRPWIDDRDFSEIVAEGYYHDRAADNKFFSKAVENIIQEPLLTLSYALQRIIKTWTYFPGTRDYINNKLIYYPFQLFQIIVLFLALMGLFAGEPHRSKFILIIPALSFSVVLFFSIGLSRFLIPAMPFILLLTGQGMAYLIEKFKLKKTAIN